LKNDVDVLDVAWPVPSTSNVAVVFDGRVADKDPTSRVMVVPYEA
jgi:hypothetical protein